MGINVPGTAEKLAGDYTQLGAFIGLTTDNPGTSAPPNHEPTGGGYARQKTTWSSPSGGGVYVGSQVTVPVPVGTYSYMIVMDAATGGNLIDFCTIPSTPITSGGGKILVTPQYTQS
jgi:hypothetical protein